MAQGHRKGRDECRGGLLAALAPERRMMLLSSVASDGCVQLLTCVNVEGGAARYHAAWMLWVNVGSLPRSRAFESRSL